MVFYRVFLGDIAYIDLGEIDLEFIKLLNLCCYKGCMPYCLSFGRQTVI